MLGIVLPVEISEHCCTKKSFKMFALVSTLVTVIQFSRIGGIPAMLFLFVNLFKVVQYVLIPLLRSDKFLPSFR